MWQIALPAPFRHIRLTYRGPDGGCRFAVRGGIATRLRWRWTRGAIRVRDKSAANNISAYTIDQTTGALTAVAGRPFSAGTSPYVIVVIPWLPSSMWRIPLDNTVSAYTIDTTTGALNSISGSPFANGGGNK